LSRNAVAKGLDPNTTLVKAVMNRKTCRSTTADRRGRQADEGARHPHLAVTKNETVVGIISISDILQFSPCRGEAPAPSFVRGACTVPSGWPL
jgi:hypothetical protein